MLTFIRTSIIWDTATWLVSVEYTHKSFSHAHPGDRSDHEEMGISRI